MKSCSGFHSADSLRSLVCGSPDEINLVERKIFYNTIILAYGVFNKKQFSVQIEGADMFMAGWGEGIKKRYQKEFTFWYRFLGSRNHLLAL